MAVGEGIKNIMIKRKISIKKMLPWLAKNL